MDTNKIPETMEEVDAQVALMSERGFPVTQDDVIKEALKAGFQDIVDERMEGSYYSVRWDAEFKALEVYNFDTGLVGRAVPADGGADFIAQFKANAMGVWFTLDKEAGKIIGR
ncbi:MAG: hypothetical protein LBT80_05990 [Lactobacillaceae bacterium]|jgi:hypothetical protein|nr:hypothetical protein [Lactobacillaceae bacterium]